MKYFLTYQRCVYTRELDPMMYASQGMEKFIENIVVDDPIAWLENEISSNPTHKITILFWVEINEQQKEKLDKIAQRSYKI
jgi:hypothetical protein